MNKIFLIVASILMSSQAFSQRVLEWSIGEPKIDCGETIKISYPLQVTMKNTSELPILGTSTIRFFYDANYLTNFSIDNIQNGYSKSGLNQSNPVFGDVFGFSSHEGIFTQFNVLDNAQVSPIYLSDKPVYLLDLSFEVTKTGEEDWIKNGTLLTPIVLDNNVNTLLYSKRRNYIDSDTGFLKNDAGIVGNYFLNGNLSHSYSANDEVKHYGWQTRDAHIGKVLKVRDRVGVAKQSGIENICRKAKSEILPSEENMIDLFTAYPVPFDKEVNLRYKFNYKTDVRIEIYDVKGAMIFNTLREDYEANSTIIEKFDLSKIGRQMLLVRLTTNKAVSIKKIMPLGE